MRAPTPHFAPPPFDMLERGMAGSLLVDPPQHAASWSPKGQGRAPSQQYRTLTLIELMQWPIGTLAADDCWLWLWLSCIHAAKVEALMEAWGFKYSSIGFTWVKLRKGYQPDQRGSFTINDFPFITGHTTRKNCETCYLGRRGRPKRLSARVPELIIAPRREHSRKPDEQYARIEAFGAGPFLELFARQRVPGWMSWGAEVDKF
jgi:N6-adenosine-specific RNA methylase IME4